MAGPPRKSGKPTGWREAGGTGPSAPAGQRRRWQPGDAPAARRSGRWAKVAAVAVGLCVVAGGLGYLAWVLWPARPPLLVVVGADPARDCLRLDVPPDYAGWRTGEQLVRWGRAEEQAAGRGGLAPKVVADGDRPRSLPTDAAGLDDFAAQLAGGTAPDGRVLLYLGLHAGTDRDGRPVLLAGGGRTLPVADLLGKLADRLPDRDVVVLLDPGRLPPDPQAGRLADPFADRLKKDADVQAVLARAGRLVVVCGADAGQTGWESEDLQLTAFGHALLRGLRGEATTATGAVRVNELFAFVRSAADAWTGSNRPTAQTPFLLPAGPAGDERAARLVASYRRPDPAPAPPAPDAPGFDALYALWARHDKLDSGPVPPASYAPLAWRRGRELLVRLQQATRFGERGAAGELQPAVDAEFKTVERAEPRPVKEARAASIPLAERFGDKPAADADAVLRRADEPDGLRLVEADKLRGLGDGRPSEAHLAVMVDDFFTKRAAGTPPATWAKAFAVRRAAERAAFAGAAFGERAWPAIEKVVLAADAKRREAEDRLFATAPDEHARADALLKQAADEYAAATALGTLVRDGSAVRDKLFADLPFLGRWAVSSHAREAVEAAAAGWAAAQTLSDALDAPGPNLARAVADGRSRDAKLRGLFAAAAGPLADAPQSQDKWLAHEHLLACPVGVPADRRRTALAQSRDKTRDWLTGTPPPTRPADAVTRDDRSKQAAVAVARLTAAAARDSKLLARADDLDGTGADWADRAGVLGADLLAHLRAADKGLAPKEYPAADAPAAAERASRAAVPLAPTDAPEPAAVAAALRWQALLVGLAGRAARDHWSDEAELPYWRRTANRLLADARTAARDLPRVAGAPAVPADYADAPRVGLASEVPGPLAWTSQRRREVGFRAVLPPGFPADVAGLAVGWREPAAGPLRWADGGAGRDPLPVAAGKEPGRLAGVLELADAADDAPPATADPAARVYFRGQGRREALRVAVNRTPDRVIREPLPPPTGATVAVRADPDVPLGEVAILLDYSGSMREDVGGGLPDVRGWRDRPNTKFRRAQEAVRAVLADLPRGTPLRVRLFSDKEDEGMASRQVFPEPGGEARVTWGSTEDKAYRDLVGRLGRYEPYYFTPLVRSIQAAVDADFTWAGDGAKLPKTLVVLTDGADEEREYKPGEDRKADLLARAGKLVTPLGDAVKGRVALFVVPFGQSADDKEPCDRLFRGVRGFDPPGRLFDPAETGDLGLTDTLLAAVYPKLVVRDSADATPVGVERSGLPARRDARREPPLSTGNGTRDLYWSPFLPRGGYNAWASTGRDAPPVRLTLHDGDAVVLGFAPAGPRRVQVRRELLADYYDQGKGTTKMQAGRRWAVTAPWPVAARQGFEAITFVERVPPHRRGPAEAGDDSPDLSAAPPDRDADGAELVWFDVLPNAEGMKPGRLTVTRLFGHPAPAWKLERADWTGPDLRGKVRAVVATRDDGLPPPVRARLPVTRSGEPEPPPNLERAAGDDELEVRAAAEDRPPGGKPEEGAVWLVVRVRHPAGRPVLARLAGSDLPAADAEHRYYPPADGRGDYTASFKLPRAALDGKPEVRVNFAQVGWALGKGDALAVTLDPAPAHPNRTGEPKPISPPPAPAER